MYKCVECGHLFEEGEQATWTEMHGFSYGLGENFSGCPLCNGHYVETVPCSMCGAEFAENELIGDLCEDCLNNYKTNVDVCYAVGKCDSDKIELNCFLTAMFSKEEIEQILFQHLKKEEEVAEVDCSQFIETDKSWFSERLVEVLKNEIE